MTDYTTPVTVIQDELITVDKINEQWQDNIKHLHEAINSIIILEEQQTQGTDGGTFTSGAWQTRALNTEVLDVNGNCSLSSNQFTLDAGTYEIVFWAVGFSCNAHQCRIQNVTDGTTVQNGSVVTSENQDGATNGLEIATTSHGADRFTVAASKALELQHRCQTTKNTDGFGNALNATTEVYAQVWLRKVA